MYTKKFYVSGGSFHELQEIFSELPGIENTRTGYINPDGARAVFEDVACGKVKAVMGVELDYNPKKIDISTLMDILFAVTNPYSENVQGSHVGPMYRCGVYYTTEEDLPQIQLHLNFMANRGNPPAIQGSNLTVNDPLKDPRKCRRLYARAEKLVSFIPGEEEHQNFLKKNMDAATDIDVKKFRECIQF